MVSALAGEEGTEVAGWAAALLAELSDVDGAVVDPVPSEVPEGGKGLGVAAGVLVAKAAGTAAVKALVQAVRAFVSRTGRTVEISLDGDVLKLTGASREVQEQLIETWLARHPRP